ncbi:endonuclease/exonuclease/phosphatase family protein [Sphingomonas sp. 8AM]|uniref:endonuclease/exonuclease/phosphatase family protein n=1 Tax=Sphingomonas sp. 8AM TaxID=2653170 RepID=UPI0012F0EDD4|nr:endonuclease/exonuclease/phosphatase family protein [Sphingomonas sp. 8AM]VXC99380.1 Endonuclease/exonuclease/phosphatase [Sphingomonas sp. 8AM]
MLATAACTSLPPARMAPAPLPVASGPSILVDRSQERASTTIDVLSFNVEGLAWPARRGRAASLAKIGSILADLNTRGTAPDVILVQEMFSRAAVRALSRAGYPYRVWGPGRTQRRTLVTSGRVRGPRRWGKGETGFHLVGSGLAILSRYPIVAAASEPFGATHCAGFDCLSNKGAQHARITIPGVPGGIDLFNTHLNSQAESRVPAERHGAAQALQRADLSSFLAATASGRDPVIVAGDFNMAGTPGRLMKLEQALSRYTMVHRFCAAPASTCDVQMSWDGDEPWVDTEDLQLFRSSSTLGIMPNRIEAMFDGTAGQPRLSDHDGLRVTYRLEWSTRSPS